MAKLSKLTDFLDRLDEAEIHYHLSSLREGAVMVEITVPGETGVVRTAAAFPARAPSPRS